MLFLLLPSAAPAQDRAAAPSPLTLERAIEDALAQNPSLRAARLGVDAAAASTTASRSAEFPRVSFTESWQRGDQPVFVFSTLLASRRFAASNFAIDSLNHPDPIGYFHATAGIEQVFFDGGSIGASVDSARAKHQIADISAREAALTLASTVTETYGRLLATQAQGRASAASLDAGREDVARAERRRDAGITSEADVLALRVHVADLEQRVIQSDGEQVILRARLNQLMGAPLDRRFEAVEPTIAIDAASPPLAQLLAEADSQRPEIQRAAASALLADSSRRAAKSSLAPRVAGQAAFDMSGTSFPDRASAWLVGAEVRWSLGLGGGERAQMNAAAAEAARARAEAEDARAQIEVEVVTALQQLASARSRQAVGRAAVAQSRESYRIIRDRYDAGLAPVTDVLRAAGAVLDADSQRVSALVDEVMGAARLRRAVGRLQ